MKRLVPFLLSALSVSLPSPAATHSAAFGATPYKTAAATGTTFRVWAGAAQSVSVAGSFNGWDPAANPLAHEGNGVWAADVPGAKPGDGYKFVLDGVWKKDPRALQVESSAPNANCIVYDHGAFDWGGAERVVGGTGGADCIWRNDLVIYEMHVGSFAAEGKNRAATFYDAAERIPYLADLGVSAVQLMPSAEFPGDHSLGYNPADIFAIESAYGGPDGLKTFVKRAHENGIAVILDLVHNHYGPNDIAIWDFDGSSPSPHTGGMYFYNDARAATDWGDTRPDFGKEQVRAFIRDNALGLVEHFHLDGFRWDSVWNIAWTHWDGRNRGDYPNEDGRSLLDDINTRIASAHPDFFRFAEDNAFDFNMNFEADGDMEFRDGIRRMATASEDNDRDMSSLARWLTAGSLARIVHAESHDTCNEANGQHRLPRAIHGGEPQGYWATKRAFLANAVTLVAPAIPMVFAGSEYNEDYDFAAETPLRWKECAAANAGLTGAFRELVRLRRDLDGASPGFKDVGNASCTLCDQGRHLVAVSRGEDLVVAVNFGCDAQTSLALPFPRTGTWHCLFNSDETRHSPLFGGVGPARGESLRVNGATAAVDLGAYTLQVWSTSPLATGEASRVVFEPAAPVEGDTLRISYFAGDGVLSAAAAVTAHLGENGWSPTHDLAMTAREGTNGVWVLDYPLAEGVKKLDVCFTDGNAWDSNGGDNWSVAVKAAGGAAIAIAKPAESGKTVTTAAASVPFSGTAGKAVAVVWRNAATGESGRVPVAGGAWNAGETALAEGTNVLFAAAANPNAGACDNMSSEIADGANGGTGFGAWRVSATENAGTWTDPDMGWGFWANGGGLAEAARPFASPLQPGDRVSFAWRHGGIDNGGSVGFGFVNDAGEPAMEFYFPGGRDAYVCGGAETNRAAGDWTNGEQAVVFELGEDWTYEMTVGEKTFSGALAPLAEEEIAKVRMWNYSAGAGEAANVYWKGLAVEGDPLLLPEVSATCTVVRADGGTVRVTASPPVPGGADGTFFVATDAPDPAAVAEKVYLATNLENGAWAWRQATGSECALSGGGFLVTPPPSAPCTLYSFGSPP